MADRDPRKVPSHEGSNLWTSYSDLFLGLSVIFLALFFFSTLRAGVEQLRKKQVLAQVDPEQLSHVRRKLAETEQALGQARAELNRLAAKNQAHGRTVASLDGELRQVIATNLVQGLEDTGVTASVNPTSGTLTFSMDALQFPNGSAQLSEAAKRYLRNLIPTYAKSLFGDSIRAGRIAEIRITGHASPRFGLSYVDPKAANQTAKDYNLDLSRRRSQAIADFLFGKEIGTYPHKAEMRIYTRSEGLGHNRPVRAPAGVVSPEPCGPYDCAKSRRVEISFQLKDEK